MNRMPRSWRIGILGLFALVTLAACVVGGYEGDVGVGYVGGVYGPGGYDYGGWGPGYRVGPPRGGERGRGGRTAPSIPHGARGGGHGGGRTR
jgi:hypothetical protein